MKKFIFLGIALILIVGIVSVSGAKREDKISERVYSKLSNGGKVNVSIKFKEITKGISSTRSISSDKKKIPGVKHDFGNLVFAELTADEINGLKNDERIEKIEIERVMKIQLQDSVPLINASVTQETKVNDLNLTGKGETICIIDTGVNYTHPDLGGCFGNNNASSSCKVIGGYDFVNNDSDPMDDNGHGTHVSGIAAANGTITGVAPEAKIVMIKACDSGGNCADSDVIGGLQWCIDNASEFNISVISMSLGADCDLYPEWCSNTYCNSDPYAPYINQAAAKNITVVVASGNNGNYTDISSPACIENATAIGSSTKADIISSFSNRNSLVKLFAPGENINSSWKDGGYYVDSGTSMATPHAAGAFAILNGYLNAVGRSALSKHLEEILNNTGKRIYDSSSNLNYSRIDVYDALISLDTETTKNISFVSPSEVNGSYPNRNNIVVNVSSENILLKNITIKLFNSTLDLINQTNSTKRYYFFNFTNLNDGIYYFNATAYDLAGNSSNSETRTMTIDATAPSVSIVYPLNTSYNTNVNELNYTISDVNLDSCWYSVDEGANNVSITCGNNASGLTSVGGSNTWTVWTNDSAGNVNYSSVTFTKDAVSPLISFTSPTETDGDNLGNRTNVVINATASDTNLDNITIELFNSTSLINRTTTNETGNYVNISGLEDGIYYFNATAYDLAGNINATETRNVSIWGNPPKVSISSPQAKAYDTDSYSINIELNEEGYCEYSLNNGGQNASLTNSGNTSFTGSKNNVGNGEYTLSAYCNDSYGNVNYSENVSFSVNVQTSTESSGGGGGGGGTNIIGTTFVPSKKQMEEGYTRNLGKNDKIRFSLNNESHTMSVNNIGTNSVSFIVQSEPVNLTMNIGEEKKLNISSAEYFDLYLKLNGIVDGNGNVTIMEIHSPIPREIVRGITEKNTSAEYNENKTNGGAVNNENNGQKRIDWAAWFIAIAVAIGLMAIFMIWKSLIFKRYKRTAIKSVVSEYKEMES